MRHLLAVLVFVAVIRNEVQCRTLSKRSPQLSLTVLDDPITTARSHPPSPEDIEDRRQALVQALIPGGGGDGGGGAGGAAALTSLGQDLIGSLIPQGGGGGGGGVFTPLRESIQKARENLDFPRVGDVLNRVIDGAGEYRKQASGALRETVQTTANNAIKVFTTVSARGTQVIGGVFKLLRTLLDNFTLAIQNLSQYLSRNLARVSKAKSGFLARNIERTRNLLQNGRLFQPVKDASELGGNLVRGLAEDFNNLQPAITDGIATKLRVGPRLIPRLNLAGLLAPSPHNPSEDFMSLDLMGEGEGEGGYAKKREDEEPSSEASSKSEKEKTAPGDIVDLLVKDSETEKVKKKDKSSESASSESMESSEKKAEGSSKSEVTVKSTKAPSKAEKSSRSKTSKKDKSKSNASLDDLFGL